MNEEIVGAEDMARMVLMFLLGLLAGPGGVVLWLIWPAPPLDVDYGSLIISAYSDGDCQDAADMAGAFYAVDPDGAGKVVPELVRDGACAEVSRYYAPHSEGTWRIMELWWGPHYTQRDSWFEAVQFSFVLWRSLSDDRRNAGLPQEYWVDAVTLFRCGRGMSDMRAQSRYLVRDELREIRPQFVAPFDRRRADCVAHIRNELSRLQDLADSQDDPHPSLLGLILIYESRSMNVGGYFEID